MFKWILYRGREFSLCCKARHVIRINCRILDCIPLYSRNIINLRHATTLSNNYFIIENIISLQGENWRGNVTENMWWRWKCLLSIIFDYFNWNLVKHLNISCILHIDFQVFHFLFLFNTYLLQYSFDLLWLSDLEVVGLCMYQRPPCCAVSGGWGLTNCCSMTPCYNAIIVTQTQVSQVQPQYKQGTVTPYPPLLGCSVSTQDWQ